MDDAPVLVRFPAGHVASSAAHSSHNRVAVVVLNWNGAALTVKCLEHLRRQSVEATIIVVDNGSTDGSVVRIQAASAIPFVLVPLQSNVGFAGGMNAGIRQALEQGAEYVWVLNNDAFAAPDCLEAVVAFMDDHPDIAAVSPRLLNLDGSEQHAGGVIDWKTGEPGFRLAADLASAGSADTWLAGTALLLRARHLKRTGLFDRELFAYWEDVDLCLRLRDNGGGLAIVPRAIVHHDSGSSSGGAASPIVHFLSTRNEWHVLSRHMPREMKAGSRGRYCAKMFRRAGQLRVHGNENAAVATVRALRSAMLNQFGPPPPMANAGVWARVALTHPWRLANICDWCARLPARMTA